MSPSAATRWVFALRRVNEARIGYNSSQPAEDVGPNGHIVGWGQSPAGGRRAFMLVPFERVRRSSSPPTAWNLR